MGTRPGLKRDGGYSCGSILRPFYVNAAPGGEKVRLESNERKGNERAIKTNRTNVYHSHPGIPDGTPVFSGNRAPMDALLVYRRKGRRITVATRSALRQEITPRRVR